GLLFAIAGLVTLAIGAYWSFCYTRFARELDGMRGSVHPKKSAVIHLLQQGVLINTIGMVLTLLGVEVIVGTLLAKSLTQAGGLALYNNSQLIEPLDMLVIQANINTIVAQFVGIILASRLTGRLSHH
ncbi:MAG: DUF3611 family protein, partial [Elainellaceae cyanobacterium]